ncbi:DsbA family protein [Embleya sp. NBC_00896]|uniref:DsbA family protein n=1 Tax=Embleya sp. NBC_00896 TaxID=2975961 RepID=UPI00386D90C6|nr:DsbA family protein [Embleya sp. NBC_00896]
MSSKNSEGKRTARERMAQERARQQAIDKRKRVMVIAGAVVAVLAVVAIIGVIVGMSKTNKKKGPWKDALAEPASAPANLSPDGLGVTVGSNPNAPSLIMYEDFRCPICHEVEKALGPTMRALADEGKIKIDYHIASFLDGKLGGNGSKYAANAAGCAQNAGKFAEYHDTLFANQPDELDDKFASRSYLLELAGKVEGLRSPAFDQCVNDLAVASWVDRVNTEFQDAKIGDTPVTGTPTAGINGKMIDLIVKGRGLATPEELRAQIEAATKS